MSGTGNRFALDAGQNASIADFFNSIRTNLPIGKGPLQKKLEIVGEANAQTLRVELSRASRLVSEAVQ
jgi:hypothetical protein